MMKALARPTTRAKFVNETNAAENEPMSSKEKLDPPALPDALRDARDSRGPQSSWDLLAAAVIEDSHLHHYNRCRVRWIRYAWLKWCCGERMRIGQIEHQDKSVTFGWQRNHSKFAACRCCGRFEDLVL